MMDEPLSPCAESVLLTELGSVSDPFSVSMKDLAGTAGSGSRL